MEKLSNSSMPKQILSYLMSNAPVYQFAENSYRRLSISGIESDEYAASYSSIMIYIQYGLQEYEAIIKKLIWSIFKLQCQGTNSYIIIPAGFGCGAELRNTKYSLYTKCGAQLPRKLVQKIMKITNSETSEVPAILSALFPDPDHRKHSFGIHKCDKNSLIIIIGKKDEVQLAPSLIPIIKNKLRRRVLFIEIGETEVNWYIYGKKPDCPQFVCDTDEDDEEITIYTKEQEG